jgi:aminoglycoside phosphotransferase (APT) family kinase protein
VPYSEDLVRSIAERHGLSADVAPMPKGGMVNDAWSIGGTHVLRIVAEGMDPECDTEAPREAAVVPLLTAAGIRTPRLVAHGIEGRPYTIYERAPGELIGFSTASYGHFAPAWRQLGHDLRALHSVTVTEEVRAHLHVDKGPDYEKWIARAIERGALDQATAEDVRATAKRLDRPAPRACLVHNDVHPWNLMSDTSTGSLTAILDWGDAAYGDPARDFGMMPLPCVPAMLEAYTDDPQEREDIAARALVVGLSVALFEASSPEMAQFERRWWRMPPGGWEEMKSQFADLWPQLGSCPHI